MLHLLSYQRHQREIIKNRNRCKPKTDQRLKKVTVIPRNSDEGENHEATCSCWKWFMPRFDFKESKQLSIEKQHQEIVTNQPNSKKNEINLGDNERNNKQAVSLLDVELNLQIENSTESLK